MLELDKKWHILYSGVRLMFLGFRMDIGGGLRSLDNNEIRDFVNSWG